MNGFMGFFPIPIYDGNSQSNQAQQFQWPGGQWSGMPQWPGMQQWSGMPQWPGMPQQAIQVQRPAPQETQTNLKHQTQRTAQSSELKPKLADRTFSANSISEGDLERIATLCGTNNIEEIYDVTPMQAFMVNTMQKVKGSFLLQFLIRTKMKLDPIAFREQVDTVCEKQESMRSVFAFRGMDRVYRVILRTRTAEVNFYDIHESLEGKSQEEIDKRIETIMNADRQRGFDLEKDRLLRIDIYRMDEDDTYAILLSQPHVNSDGISITMLIRDLFVAYSMKQEDGKELPVFDSSYRDYAQYLKSVDKRHEIAFWLKYLEGAGPACMIPGYMPSDLDYELSMKFHAFNKDSIVKVRKLQKQYKATFATIIQAVWAVLVAHLTGTEDVIFGSITAGRDAAVSDSMKISGGFVNALPIRVRIDEDMPFGQMVRDLQTDVQQAMSNSHCSLDEIAADMGRKEPLTNHVLNFHNYRSAGGFGEVPPIPGLHIVGVNVYDNLSYDLTLYFTESGDHEYGCMFAFNTNTYSIETIQLLGECFSQYIDQLAQDEGDMRPRDFPKPDLALFETAGNAMFAEKYKKAAFLKQLPICRELTDAEILYLAESSVIRRYKESNRVFGADDLLDSIYLVIDGFFCTEVLSTDGWNRPVSIDGKGKILTLAGLSGVPPEVTVSAYSDEASILAIPASKLNNVLGWHPSLGIELARLFEQRCRMYEKLWVNEE